MIFNIAYAKKTFHLFFPKKQYATFFFILPWTTGGLSLCAAWSRMTWQGIVVLNIPDIAKIITDLWINFKGNCDRGRFLGFPFWISLGVLGVVCTSRGMIRRWSLWPALTTRRLIYHVRYLHPSLIIHTFCSHWCFMLWTYERAK
jgi:hypothetical protein